MRAIACLAAIALLSGCVGSIMPIHDDEDLIFDPALLGFWTDEDSSGVAIVTEGAELTYSVEYIEDCDRGAGVVHLANIGGSRFFDGHVELAGDLPAIPIHGIALLDAQTDSTLSIRTLSYDWLDDFLEQDPEAIAHLDDGLLTARTADLQRFYLAHLQTPDAYDDPESLIRLDAAAAERLVGRLTLAECPPPPPPLPPDSGAVPTR